MADYFLYLYRNHRILTHLQKCRRNYAKAQRAKGLEVEYGYCKFNYVHHLPLIELPFHESKCEDQYSVLQHIAYHCSGKQVLFFLNSTCFLRELGLKLAWIFLNFCNNLTTKLAIFRGIPRLPQQGSQEDRRGESSPTECHGRVEGSGTCPRRGLGRSGRRLCRLQPTRKACHRTSFLVSISNLARLGTATEII